MAKSETRTRRSRRPAQRKGYIMFVPVMVTPDMLSQMQTMQQGVAGVQLSARPPVALAHERPVRTRTEPKPEMAGAVSETPPKRGRGRVAGIYVAKPKEPSKVTDSIKRVYDFVRAHKRGVPAKDIQTRLDMPTGTVGWALGQLLKQGSVEHVAAAA